MKQLSFGRRTGETLMIGNDVTVTVLAVNENGVRLGIHAPGRNVRRAPEIDLTGAHRTNEKSGAENHDGLGIQSGVSARVAVHPPSDIDIGGGDDDHKDIKAAAELADVIASGVAVAGVAKVVIEYLRVNAQERAAKRISLKHGDFEMEIQGVATDKEIEDTTRKFMETIDELDKKKIEVKIITDRSH